MAVLDRSFLPELLNLAFSEAADPAKDIFAVSPQRRGRNIGHLNAPGQADGGFHGTEIAAKGIPRVYEQTSGFQVWARVQVCHGLHHAHGKPGLGQPAAALGPGQVF